MSRNGIDPSSFTSSQVNLILACMELRCCRKLFLFFFLIIVNVSSTNLLHIYLHIIVTSQTIKLHQQVYHSGKGRPESHKSNQRGNTYMGQ